MVNALQRRADVIVQKSLAEGFGLTVAEAMWKARPVVASRIGGIQDQIVDGESGLLIDDPADLEAAAAAIDALLADPAGRARSGSPPGSACAAVPGHAPPRPVHGADREDALSAVASGSARVSHRSPGLRPARPVAAAP